MFSALLHNFRYKKQENFQAQCRSPPLRAIVVYCMLRFLSLAGASSYSFFGLRAKPALGKDCIKNGKGLLNNRAGFVELQIGFAAEFLINEGIA